MGEWRLSGLVIWGLEMVNVHLVVILVILLFMLLSVDEHKLFLNCT
jgi:hypothetical protein